MKTFSKSTWNVRDVNSKFWKSLILLQFQRFAENWLEWIDALVAVFGTNIEMSPYDSKRVPKWRYLVEKNIKHFHSYSIVKHKLNVNYYFKIYPTLLPSDSRLLHLNPFSLIISVPVIYNLLLLINNHDFVTICDL